ncbi:hypothetical protein [Nocardia sp. NPDC057030]|uniref:hypothetical protein n=1 Tax=unclassified Nocardia TaxID=2637762 RepID=UPI00363B827F
MNHNNEQYSPSDAEIAAAAYELRAAIALKTSALADGLLGRPQWGTTEWEREWSQRDTAEGQARSAQWHLTKIRIERAADVDPLGNVINARIFGADWDQIGAAYGISATEAESRWDQQATDYTEYLDTIPTETKPQPAHQKPSPIQDRRRTRIERGR